MVYRAHLCRGLFLGPTCIAVRVIAIVYIFNKRFVLSVKFIAIPVPIPLRACEPFNDYAVDVAQESIDGRPGGVDENWIAKEESEEQSCPCCGHQDVISRVVQHNILQGGIKELMIHQWTMGFE